MWYVVWFWWIGSDSVLSGSLGDFGSCLVYGCCLGCCGFGVFAVDVVGFVSSDLGGLVLCGGLRMGLVDSGVLALDCGVV